MYLTLTRATDAAPPEEAKPSYINPYDDPFELYRKVPKERPETPPVIKLSHQVSKLRSSPFSHQDLFIYFWVETKKIRRKKQVKHSDFQPNREFLAQVVKALPYKDPRDIKAMVQDVLRSFREHPQYMKMGHVREYQEATACFQLRCAVVQWPDK